jgi:hypothetical protein
MASPINALALSESLSYCESAGYIVSVGVAIGCAGEFVHEWTTWFRTYSWWRQSGGKASALLLVAALAIEIPIQVHTNSLSGQIIAFLNNEAAQATKSTIDLGDKFGDLNHFVQTKSAEIDSAKQKLKEGKDAFDKAHDDALQASNNAKNSLSEVTSLVSTENALQNQLSKQLTDAKRNIEEYQKAIDPRRLTDPQKSTLASLLHNKPKGKLIIYAYNGAFDSKLYADQIAEAIRTSGWDVTVEIGGGPFWDNGGSGNHIHYGDSASHDAAKILYSAIKASSIPIDDNLGPEPVYKVMPDKVVLFIGTKY